MKAFKVGLAFLSIALVALIAVGVSGGFSESTRNANLKKLRVNLGYHEVRQMSNAEVDDSVTGFVLNLRGTKVNVTQGENFSVRLGEVFEGEFSYVVDGGIITVTENSRPRHEKSWVEYVIPFPVVQRSKIDIVVPRGHNIDSFVVNISSGKLDLSNLVAKNVEINSSSGNVEVCNVEAEEDISIELKSGKVELENIKAKNIVVNGSSGGLEMENTSADSIDIEVGSGSIKIDKVFAGKLTVKSLSGGIRIEETEILGELVVEGKSGFIKVEEVTAKVITAINSSGGIWLEECSAENYYVTNSSGSIKMDIIGARSDYGLDITNRSGSVRVDGERYDNGHHTVGDDKIVIKNSSGSIRLNFDLRGTPYKHEHHS